MINPFPSRDKKLAFLMALLGVGALGSVVGASWYGIWFVMAILYALVVPTKDNLKALRAAQELGLYDGSLPALPESTEDD